MARGLRPRRGVALVTVDRLPPTTGAQPLRGGLRGLPPVTGADHHTDGLRQSTHAKHTPQGPRPAAVAAWPLAPRRQLRAAGRVGEAVPSHARNLETRHERSRTLANAPLLTCPNATHHSVPAAGGSGQKRPVMALAGRPDDAQAAVASAALSCQHRDGERPAGPGEPGDPVSGGVASSTAEQLQTASGLYRPLQATNSPSEPWQLGHCMEPRPRPRSTRPARQGALQGERWVVEGCVSGHSGCVPGC